MKGLDCEAGDSGSGWHNSHLRGLAQNFGNDERAKSVVDKLDEHGARFASGELDPWYLRLLLINRLLAAKKPGGGGVRPIGIGCALRRLLSAGTRAAHKDTVHAYCFPIQVATGETSAMQKLALGTRIILEHGTAAVVSGDAANAYNSLERASLLRFLASPEAEEAGLLPLLPAAHAQLSLATVH